MVRRTVAYALAYALAILIGRLIVLPETNLALFWPAAGVGALWAMVTPRRRELVVVGGAIWVLATVGLGLTGIAWDAAAVLGVANVANSVGTAFGYSWLTSRSSAEPVEWHGGGSAPMRRLGDVGRFALAAAVATVASGVIGMAGLTVGDIPVTGQTALGWVLRNGAAIIIIAGTGLAMRGQSEIVNRRHLIEAVPVLLVSLAVLWLVFGPGRTISLSFLPLAVLVWGGLRLPVPLAALQGATTAVVTLGLVVVTSGSPFGDVSDVAGQALTLQAFMMLATLLSLVLSTVQWERDRLVSEAAAAGLTSRRQAEDLRVITETIPDALIVMDREGKVLLHNDAARRWLAPSSDGDGELTSLASPPRRRRDGRALPKRERPSLRALDGETVRGLVVEADDLSSGMPRLVSVDAVPLRDSITGLPDRALLVLRDVTDENRRLDDVEAAHARTERLIADAPHGVAVLDMRGRILQVNSSLAAITGQTVEALVGRSFDDLAPDNRDEIAEHLHRAVLIPGSRVVGEWTVPGPGLDEVHVALTSRVISAQDGADDVILVNVVDLSERRRYEQRLAHLADHDVLTGLPNRRRFEAALAEHLDLCARSGPRGALLLLDLDHFKEVNDTMGHDAGDELIVSVAGVLRQSLRDTDLVARLGGDEFAILLPAADREGAERVATVVVEAVRANNRTLEGVNRRVTASIGVVTFAGAHERAEDVLALADMLMYDAKDAGRDRFTVLDDSTSVQPRSGARMEWKARIEAALENDEFELYLQPLLHLDTGRVTSAEALIRLVDRDVPVSPGAFIGVAERAGLAPAVDAWVVRHGIALLGRLLEVDPAMRLSVNLSAHSIGDPAIALTIEHSLHEHGVDPHRLTVEVTETAAVADVEAARGFAEPLRALGIEFSLDDFGAGYGSFYYLKHLSFDTIKIDGEFVKGAHDSAVDRAILRSVIGIARALGKRTVAEFVTDEGALSVVRELGVDYAQGYLIGEPVPFDQFVSTHLVGDRGLWIGLPPVEEDSHSHPAPGARLSRAASAGRHAVRMVGAAESG